MSEWQPIETAPKESNILGWNKNDGVLVYRAFHYGSNNKFAGWFAVYDHEGDAEQPTHWMPLPPPPDGT